MFCGSICRIAREVGDGFVVLRLIDVDEAAFVQRLDRLRIDLQGFVVIVERGFVIAPHVVADDRA